MRWTVPIFAVAMLIAAWKFSFPAHPPTTTPSLLKAWEVQLYLLDDDEDVRFIPPPFSPERFQQYVSMRQRSQPHSWQIMSRVSDRQISFTSVFPGEGTVHSAVLAVSYLDRPPHLELAESLGKHPADGDWIVRQEASLDRRMKALESILSGVTGLNIAIEHPTVEREVIVARGKWDFHPSSDWQAPHFYVANRDRFGGSGTLAQSFASLEIEMERKIIDETEAPRPTEVYWTGTPYLLFTRDYSRRNEILASLQKQTALKWVQEKRKVPVWIVSKREGTIKPIDNK